MNGFDSVAWLIASDIALSLLLAALLLRWHTNKHPRRRGPRQAHGLLAACALFLVWVAGFMLTHATEGHHLWYGLGLGGVLGLFLLAWQRPSRWANLRQAEERRMTALDL